MTAIFIVNRPDVAIVTIAELRAARGRPVAVAPALAFQAYDPREADGPCDYYCPACVGNLIAVDEPTFTCQPCDPPEAIECADCGSRYWQGQWREPACEKCGELEAICFAAHCELLLCGPCLISSLPTIEGGAVYRHHDSLPTHEVGTNADHRFRQEVTLFTKG